MRYDIIALYSSPTSVVITDIHQPTLDNLSHNLTLNDFSMSVSSKFVNWVDAASFPEPADVILGSDLVYDSNILSILVPAIDAMLVKGDICAYMLNYISSQAEFLCILRRHLSELEWTT